MPGVVANLDGKQKEIFEKFKERIKDCRLKHADDEHIVKWLIVRDFNLDQAEKMLRSSLEWRRIHRVDELLDTWHPPEVLVKYYPFGKTGVDKFGGPLWISAQGRTDLRGILQCIPKKEFIKFGMYMLELIDRGTDEESIKSGKQINTITIIFDMEGLTMRQIAHKQTIECDIEFVKMFEDHYPEILRRIFVVNAPKLFGLLFNLIKPFMHQTTVSKVRIYGSNKSEWTAALLDEIHADQLPAHYGGSLTSPDGDSMCPHIVQLNLGGGIPEEYFLNKTPEVKDYMETASIMAGTVGRKKLKFKVDKVNSVLKWEFITEGGDIGFRVYYKNPKEGNIDLVPLERVQSHMLAEEGQLVCENEGNYTVEFDNTYSYFRGKKLRYHVVVEPPGKN